MATIRRQQTIAAPIAVVFATISNLETFQEWNPTIKTARKLSDGPIGEGAEFEFQIRGIGRTVQRLEDFVPNERVRLVPQNGPITGGHLFVLSSRGDSTLVDHELVMNPKGPFKLLSPLMAKMGEKNLHDTAEALQTYLER